MQIDFAVTKLLGTVIVNGQEGSLEKANSFGCANPVGMPTKIISFVIIVNKFTLILESMQTSMGRSGFSVSHVRSGCILSAKLRMDTKT